MGYIYKLKPEITKFIFLQKNKLPEISCRKLVVDINQKFGIKISKSAVNNLLKKENLNSPLGRKPKKAVNLEGVVEHGGIAFLQAMDYHLGLSYLWAEILKKLFLFSGEISLRDIQNILQAVLIYYVIYGKQLDAQEGYYQDELWKILGERPSKAVYQQVMKKILTPQLVMNELVKELRRGLTEIAGVRFLLNDGSIFLIDARHYAFWEKIRLNRSFSLTYCKAKNCVDEFVMKKDAIFFMFSGTEGSLFSPETLNFVLSFHLEFKAKHISKIEFVDVEGNICDILHFHRGGVDTYTPAVEDGWGEERFFALGFWPWQLETLSLFERNLAEEKIVWDDFGVSAYYQISEIKIPQYIVRQDVKFNAIFLRNSPSAPIKIGVLTNLPKKKIHNLLNCKELYSWMCPEDKYKNFFAQKRMSDREKPVLSSLNALVGGGNDELKPDLNVEAMIKTLADYLFLEWRDNFLPLHGKDWSFLKIKDVFFRQKADIKRKKDFVIYNIVIDDKTGCEKDFVSLCNSMNQLEIGDNEGRWLRFVCRKKALP